MKKKWILEGALLLSNIWAVATVQPAHAIDKNSLVAGGTLTGTNGFYVVYVQDMPGTDLGKYTATTGPSHPAGGALNVLYGGGAPGTSFNTIRSYTSGTDYIQDAGKSSVNPTVSLGQFGTVTSLGSTGVRTTYVLPGGMVTPDALTIVQDVKVNGTTLANSTVEVTTSITNNGTGPVQIGIRYLWDFQIGVDDGPTFMALNPDGAVLVDEAQFLPPAFESYRIEDNDGNPMPPTFDVLGTVTGPASVVPPPTAPDLLQYVSWANSFPTAFDYTVNPALGIASSNPLNDSAVLYFFGPNSNSAITIPAGQQRTVSASLFLRQATPSAPPTSAPAASPGGLLCLAVLLGGVGAMRLSRRRRPAGS